MSTPKTTGKQGALIISLDQREKERDNYRKDHANKKSRWFQASRNSRLVVDHMRRITPSGAAKPWRSGPSVEPIEALLADGAELQEMLDHAEDCAALVVRGVTDARWWYPSHVFGARTMPRWAADAAKMHAVAEAAKQRQAELAAMDTSRTVPARPFSGDVVPVALASFAQDLEKMLSRTEDHDPASASESKSCCADTGSA